MCASTGNTSASAAAYAARAGMTCAVLVPQGKIALGKLAQAVAHGARILQVDGNFDDCLELARKTAADYPVTALVNSVNPVRIAGPEDRRVRDLRRAGPRPGRPLPAGRQRRQHHRVLDGLPRVPRRRDGRPTAPRMFGFQAAGAAPLVHGAPVRAPGDDRHRHPDRRTRRPGPRRSLRVTTPAGCSTPSPTSRSSPPTAAVRARGGVRRAGVGGVRGRAAAVARPTAGCRAGRWWSAR